MSLRNELATAIEEGAEAYQAINRLWAEAPALIDFDQLADLYYSLAQSATYIQAHASQLGNNVEEITEAKARVIEAEENVNQAIREVV